MKTVNKNIYTKFLIDKFLIIYLTGPFSFLLGLTQNNIRYYLLATYTYVSVLLLLIVYKNYIFNKLKTEHIIPIIVLILFCLIEYIHFTITGKSIHNLPDIRMIIYSSFYGSIITFTIYAIYLGLSSIQTRIFHLKFSIIYFSYFHFLYALYWVVLYMNLIEPIPHTAYLENNSISYQALFVLLNLFLLNDVLGISKIQTKLFIAISLLMIALNTTLGAALILLSFIFLFKMEKLSKYFLIFITILFLLIIESTSNTDEITRYFIGSDHVRLSHHIEENEKDFSKEYPVMSVTHVFPAYDERTLSAFSRIYTNYFSLMLFMDNAFIGIGQAYTYSIKLFGSGIHSFLFLLLTSTGIIGTILFITLLLSLNRMFQPTDNKMAIIFFSTTILIFINSLPVYLTLLLLTGQFSYIQKYTPIIKLN